MITRPVRERSLQTIGDMVENGIRMSGFEEVGLLSLSSADHTEIAEVANALNVMASELEAARGSERAFLLVAVVGTLVFFGVQLNPSEAQAKDFPGRGDAIDGRTALADAGISAGVMKPFVVLVENGANREAITAKLRKTPGVAGAVAPPDWIKGQNSLVEAFPASDGSAKSVRSTIKRVRAELEGTGGTLGGVAAEDRDFVAAVYSNFPYVLGFVVLLTFILLARAFRSLVLPLKAVVLNLVSLLAAYGIIVFIFQQGHGAEAIWGVHATQSIIPWIPLMIFAFLFGLSMDYEVFMMSRMREAYDESGDTRHAVSLGLARTGKLVTSAALVLMFAFFVLSSGPGVDIKQFGIGLAAGIIFDATVIRALLVPSLMRLMGKWNWWLPQRAARVLRVSRDQAAEPV
jgi:RND superfamily putative drug exporter